MVMGQLFGQELQCYGASQACVFSLVDYPHAPTTEFLKNEIV
jgi:hypothetical protein